MLGIFLTSETESTSNEILAVIPGRSRKSGLAVAITTGYVTTFLIGRTADPDLFDFALKDFLRVRIDGKRDRPRFRLRLLH